MVLRSKKTCLHVCIRPERTYVGRYLQLYLPLIILIIYYFLQALHTHYYRLIVQITVIELCSLACTFRDFVSNESRNRSLGSSPFTDEKLPHPFRMAPSTIHNIIKASRRFRMLIRPDDTRS